MMKGSMAICWTLILLAAVFFDGIDCKGGRGGARGSARGSARRAKSSSRYSSSGLALRVAAAAAAGGAAAVAAGRMGLIGEGSPGNAESQSGNSTGEGSYNYRAWTSGAQPWHYTYLPACLLCVASFFSL